MADIDNMRGDTLRVVEENTLDNMRGVTQRVINENSIDNTRGVTYRVYNVNGGSAPVIDELNVTPSTSAQTITAPSGTDGYSPVNVSAVTSAIDANIVAGNIKKDVNILGVTGSYEGNVPTGTMYIISNGTYNVADKAIANVNVPTSVGAKMNLTMYNNNLRFSAPIDLTGITNFNMNGLNRTAAVDISWFEGSTGAAFINANDLTTISILGSCMYLFNKCTGITSVDLPSLTTITDTYTCLGMFYECTGLISVNLPNLTTVSGSGACRSMFSGCSGLTSVDLSGLTTVSAQDACRSMFYNCTLLTTVYIGGTTAIDFGAYTNQFTGIFNGCTQNIDVYAPAANQTQIEAFSDYPNFGGTGTVTWHWRS